MTKVIEWTETWATIEATEAARERRRRRQQTALARRRRGGSDRLEAGCEGEGAFAPGRADGAKSMAAVFGPGAGGKGWDRDSPYWCATARAAPFSSASQPLRS